MNFNGNTLTSKIMCPMLPSIMLPSYLLLSSLINVNSLWERSAIVSSVVVVVFPQNFVALTDLKYTILLYIFLIGAIIVILLVLPSTKTPVRGLTVLTQTCQFYAGCVSANAPTT
jgi:hypothetical protein